jgi:transcriptional regulator with XRE-family HTH domain
VTTGAVTPSERLAAALEERGWTQDELAHRTGIARTTVNGYVNGRLGIGRKNGRRIAGVLGLAEDYFNGGGPKPTVAMVLEAVQRHDAQLQDVLARIDALERRST